MRMSRVATLLVSIFLFAAPAQASPPVFHGILNGAIDASVPAPQSGGDIIFSGDSITWGLGTNQQGTNGCSAYTYPSPCYADQVTSHYTGMTEVNDGVPGSCLESDSVTGSLCNYPATAGSGQPLISRYTTTMLPYCGNNKNWFSIMIGINDIGSATSRGDTTVNVTTYKSDLGSIVNACENAGTPPGQIILNQITYGEPSAASASMTYEFNAAIAEVAQQYHTRLGMTYQATAYCPNRYNASTPGCLYDSVHPDNTGHANIATQIENATYVQAIAAQSANNVASYILSGQSQPNPISFPTYTAGSASQVWIGQDGGATAGTFLNVPTGSTNGWRFIVNNGTTTAATISAAGALSVGSSVSSTYHNFATYAAGPSTGVWIGQDGAGTAGTYFNVPTSSTNGWRWIVNNGTVTAAQLTAAGEFIPGASIQFNTYGAGSASNVWLGSDNGATKGMYYNIPTSSTNGYTWLVNNGTVTAFNISAAGVPKFYNHSIQSSTCLTDCKVTLSSGTATWTFGTAYSTAAVCTATPEGAPPTTTVSIAESVSTTAVTVSAYTSSGTVNTADTRVVDIHCAGYPN